jgi:hypothetical protein
LDVLNADVGSGAEGTVSRTRLGVLLTVVRGLANSIGISMSPRATASSVMIVLLVRKARLRVRSTGPLALPRSTADRSLHIDVTRGRVVGGEGYGKDDPEGGPGARHAAKGDRAAMVFDDLVGEGEAKACAGGLGREERVEDFVRFG